MRLKVKSGPGPGMIVAAALVLLVAGAGYGLITGGPSTSDSVKVLCALRDDTSGPLVDMTESNSRDDLVVALRKRAVELEEAASQTSGTIRDALTDFASAMSELADSVQSDVSGEALGEAIDRLATDSALAKAEKTLNDVLDNKC